MATRRLAVAVVVGLWLGLAAVTIPATVALESGTGTTTPDAAATAETPAEGNVSIACPRDAIDDPAPLTAEPSTATGGSTEPAAATNATATNVETPYVAELYPNPTVHENEGEFLVLEAPPETPLGNLSLTDGHTTAEFPNETVSGRVAATTAPAVTTTLTDDPVVELEGTVRLAVDGDRLELRRDDGVNETVLDAVAYDRAPVAERWYRGDPTTEVDGDSPATGTWWPRDGTCLPPVTADVDEATAFVLPDAPDVARETIRRADERLLLAGYTVTDPDVVDALVDAADRGVDVAVLFEASPVGGTPAATEPALETLIGADVDVRVVGGEGSRYRFHHPKYAVADDDLLVTSENWKPAGVGGESSRGWGVRLESPALADDLADVFRADAAGWDAESGADYLANASFVDPEDDQPDPSFSRSHDPETVSLESAELLLAPDNAEPRLREVIAGAEEELLVKQASVDADVAVFEETLAAARRGVDVRLLLDSTWYVEDEHEALAADLERTAAEEELSLEVRVAPDTDRFEKIHAKGVVVDGETAVVGSANWNENAFRNNREALLVLHGDEVASYYAAVFRGDWHAEGERWSLPLEFSASVVAALALAAAVGYRYVRFGAE